MKIRVNTLWKVSVYCAVASWLSFYATVYLGGPFFTLRTVGSDGVIELSADPLRSGIFHGVMFLVVLAVGGLWAFRAMTRREVAASAGIASALYLLIALAQLMISEFPLSLSMRLACVQNWTGIVASFLQSLTGNFILSVLLSCVTPMLFVLFGKKENM